MTDIDNTDYGIEDDDIPETEALETDDDFDDEDRDSDSDDTSEDHLGEVPNG